MRVVHGMQSTYTGHTGSRVKRWARILERVDRSSSGTWQEVLRRYCLLSRASHPVSDDDMVTKDYASMTDDLIMIHAAWELGRSSALRMSPEFHLRLLHALCNDVVNCFTMKSEIATRYC